jgi:dihydrofolate reductase|tara:strand:- start:135 stop:632 length:498 start_codon:yes stop_codon:yes gene_type:complete
MKLSLIVAMSRNGVIGLDNRLPWHLSEDLKYFKSVTMGKPIIMGRKTFDSIGRPLPGRCNIVITRNPSWIQPGVKIAQSIDQAMLLGRQACEESGGEEVMVIGGEQIYRMTLAVADRIYLTEVDADIKGDAFFPEFDKSAWSQVKVEHPEGMASPAYRFLVLERI